ncbi:hypothetical protein HDV00_006185 [Rhizophlyctis rosea]|nr:hypothetical protein HDV00_006185 [Rhizophlyctis rosea]
MSSKTRRIPFLILNHHLPYTPDYVEVTEGIHDAPTLFDVRRALAASLHVSMYSLTIHWPQYIKHLSVNMLSDPLDLNDTIPPHSKEKPLVIKYHRLDILIGGDEKNGMPRS